MSNARHTSHDTEALHVISIAPGIHSAVARIPHRVSVLSGPIGLLLRSVSTQSHSIGAAGLRYPGKLLHTESCRCSLCRSNSLALAGLRWMYALTVSKYGPDPDCTTRAL
jgi:hypothetical protein